MTKLKPYGPRGVIMLALAVVAFGRALAYMPSEHPASTAAILHEWPIPIPLWGAVWGLVGAFVLIKAFTRDHALALAILAVFSSLWAGIYIWVSSTRVFEEGWDASRSSWITAATYVATAVTVFCISRMINKIDREDPDA